MYRAVGSVLVREHTPLAALDVERRYLFAQPLWEQRLRYSSRRKPFAYYLAALHVERGFHHAAVARNNSWQGRYLAAGGIVPAELFRLATLHVEMKLGLSVQRSWEKHF